MDNNEGDNESQRLLKGEQIPSDTNDHKQHHSSRLEWSESSWIRFFHVLCWCWINPILSLGYKQQLTENDLNDIPHVDKSCVLLERLYSYDWSSITTSKIIIKEFWKDYVFAILFVAPFMIVCIAQPLLLRQILLDMMNKQELNIVTYLYVISLIICVIIQTPAHRQNMFRSARVGARIRNALTLIIYKHSLSLKSTSWQQMNTGHIINLIANDASKFEELCENLIYLFTGLIEGIIIFGLLCWIIKPIATLCGYALFPPFILLQLYLSRKFGQCRVITAKCTDQRVQAFSEFIYGYDIVKMYNWEKAMRDRIGELRESELASIRRTSRFRTFNVTLAFITPQLFSLITFGSAWLLGYPLNIANTFPAILYFNLICGNIMYYLPLAIEKLSETRVASKRIDSFMRFTIDNQYQSPLSISLINPIEKGNIIMSNASFSWYNEIPCLSSLNLIIKKSTFVGIVGPVGSGKSSLFSAILNEMNLINGQINTNDSSFSYTSQSPWIFADTFRNNILLNRLFDEQRYRNVIYACCLDVDLNLFGSTGDLTMIGEKGVNLSGGQKARVSLARALYTDADIYLLDDPLSAVDRLVAKQIYERCFGPDGLLKNKTRLLVTHQTQFLNESDQIIFLSNGHIDEQGCLDENIIQKDDINKNETSILSDMLNKNTSIVDDQPIITDEISVSGGIKLSLWYKLFSAPPLGKFGFCLLIILFLLSGMLNTGTGYWLSIWLKQSHINQQRSSEFAYIYFGLIIATIVAYIAFSNFYFIVVLHGSNNLHNKMLKALLYTSIQFFESNPSGRILNRASKDQQVIDELLHATLLYGVVELLLVIGSMFIIGFINPVLLLLFIILIPPVWLLVRFYQRSSHQLKRIESITRSPVYTLFSSTMNGLTTIRAFKAENSFIKLVSDKIDANTCAYISVRGASHWFAVRLSLLCSLILIGTSVRIVFFHNQMDSSAAAVSLSSAVFVSLWFQWVIQQISEANILMTSVERIDDYSHLLNEDDNGGHKRLVKTSPKWPIHGTIEFRNYSLRHRFNLDYAVRNINLRIESGQKIGIIGRTGAYQYLDDSFLICFLCIGAGKSSLFKGIFRFIDRSCVDGEILIDDIDISRITLNHLRSHLSVIPQQPILFSGTLRYNLDPFNHCSDEQCWLALEDVQLKQFVNDHSDGLLMSITESGRNLSVGQCQLICIARAILKKSKILLIDEATANVDKKTDDLIQAVITKKFQDRTVLTIAHRLNTVAKSDRILVLDKGMIVNYDTPMNILHQY